MSLPDLWFCDMRILLYSEAISVKEGIVHCASLLYFHIVRSNFKAALKQCIFILHSSCSSDQRSNWRGKPFKTFKNHNPFTVYRYIKVTTAKGLLWYTSLTYTESIRTCELDGPESRPRLIMMKGKKEESPVKRKLS